MSYSAAPGGYGERYINGQPSLSPGKNLKTINEEKRRKKYESSCYKLWVNLKEYDKARKRIYEIMDELMSCKSFDKKFLKDPKIKQMIEDYKHIELLVNYYLKILEDKHP